MIFKIFSSYLLMWVYKKINELGFMHFCVISILKSVSRNPGLDKMQINASIGLVRLEC